MNFINYELIIDVLIGEKKVSPAVIAWNEVSNEFEKLSLTQGGLKRDGTFFFLFFQKKKNFVSIFFFIIIKVV